MRSAKSKRPETEAANPAVPGLNNEQADQRVSRSKWPKDRTKRLSAMEKAMPKFIQDYYGSTVAIASAMSVTPADVREVIDYAPDLVELQEIAENSIEDLLLNQMMYLAMNTKSSAPAKFLLEKLFPEKYAKGVSQASKSKGFGAPKEKPGELPSAIKPKATEN